jgi:hypothetical protein
MELGMQDAEFGVSMLGDVVGAMGSLSHPHEQPDPSGYPHTFSSADGPMGSPLP